MAGFLGGSFIDGNELSFPGLSQDSPPRRHLQASAWHREGIVKGGVSGWRKLGLGFPSIDLCFCRSTPQNKALSLQSITRGPGFQVYTVNVLKDFCCVVLFFWLFFAGVCFGISLGGKRSNLFCFFAGVYFFLKPPKAPTKTKVMIP